MDSLATDGLDGSAWDQRVAGWVRDRLARVGATITSDVEQPRVRPWSTVVCVPTDTGPVWFKANGPGTAYEPRLVKALSRWARPRVLVPIAIDTRRAWTLLPAVGPTRSRIAAESARLPRMATILVTGGAGYIGSHTVGHLLAAGHRVVSFDNLSSGHREAVPDGVDAVCADLADAAAIRDAIKTYEPDAVVHFAAFLEVGESVVNPRAYWANNVVNGLGLLDAILDSRIIPIVFSSSSAVYGEPAKVPVGEDDPKVPTNPYGYTKLTFEHLLAHYAHAYDLPSISLRYFNACGARPDGGNGPDHRSKTQLLELALLTALGHRPYLEIYGQDYPTRDGTCIRDYVHVEDVASAHVLALDRLFAEPVTRAYNIGLGEGFTVREIIASVERVTGRPLPCQDAPRRAGDPAVLVADAGRIGRELGWSASYRDLDQIIATAWRWHTTHPNGFATVDTPRR